MVAIHTGLHLIDGQAPGLTIFHRQITDLFDTACGLSIPYLPAYYIPNPGDLTPVTHP